MNMNQVWEQVFMSLIFPRYLHTTRTINSEHLVHVGGAGDHSIQIWKHDTAQDQWEQITLDYETTGSENSRLQFFMVHSTDFE